MNKQKHQVKICVVDVPPFLQKSFEERASQKMLKMFDQVDIRAAWNKRIVCQEHRSEWEMMVILTKAQLARNFEAHVIRQARFEVR